MSEYKKLVPSFGCMEGKAVTGNGALNCQEYDCMALAQRYSDNGADEILIHDLSKTDEDHEHTMKVIKQIAQIVDVPITTGGRIKRLEDVKKYLYAGAKAVYLDVSKDEHVDLIKEASSRFGEEKIYAYLPKLKYIHRAEEYEQLGASRMILDVDGLTCDQLYSQPLSGSRFFVCCCSGDIKAIREFLQMVQIDGVILKGPIQNDNSCMIKKQELKSCGLMVDTFESSLAWSEFKLNSDGLIPVVVQDYRTKDVLMMAYMNEEAYSQTLCTGKMTYYSRSRQKLWLKGETSGHYQYVKSLSLDCDNDTILAKVNQIGAACHTGSKSCFYQMLAYKEHKDTNPLKVFEDVYHVILDRKQNPREGSYTNYLFDKGIDKILKKLGEEATEIVIAAKNPDPEEIKYEISDFLYHMMVLMAYKGITWEEITEELANR